MRSERCWFWASLSLPAEATLRILPRNGSTACEARSRACLAEPPALSPSTMKISEPWAAVLVQSASLPGRRSLRTAVLREISFSWRRRMRSSARAGSCGRGEPILGLALELRLADEHRDHAGSAGHHVVAGDRSRALALAH